MTMKDDIKTINDAIPALTIAELQTWDVLKLNDVAASVRRHNNKAVIEAAYKKKEGK